MYFIRSVCAGGLAFPYVIIIIIVERPCAVSVERESPTSESRRIVREQPASGIIRIVREKPGTVQWLNSPGEARLRRVAEWSGRGPASDSCRIVRK